MLRYHFQSSEKQPGAHESQRDSVGISSREKAATREPGDQRKESDEESKPGEKSEVRTNRYLPSL